jgi:Flp pilus assembly protein CpaB
MALTWGKDSHVGDAPGAVPRGGGVGGGPRPPRRRIERLPGVPGGRAIVGGLLVSLAGVGTLGAWQRSSASPEHAYVVAARAIAPGETIAADDLGLEPIDLPGGVAAAAFVDGEAVVGRVALGAVGEGELVQVSQVSDPGAGVPTAEVSFSLARDRAVDGRLRSGDLVDLFVTYDDRTVAVVERVRVVGVSDGGGASFATATQVTVTLALTDAGRRADVIHAVRAGEVTLVRSTHLPPAPGRPLPPPGSAGAGSGGAPVPAPGAGGSDGGPAVGADGGADGGPGSPAPEAGGGG